MARIIRLDLPKNLPWPLPRIVEPVEPTSERLTLLAERVRRCSPRIPSDAVWSIEGETAVCRDVNGEPLASLDADSFRLLCAELERRSAQS